MYFDMKKKKIVEIKHVTNKCLYEDVMWLIHQTDL